MRSLILAAALFVPTAAFALDAVSNDLAAAVRAGGRQGVDRALEGVEDV